MLRDQEHGVNDENDENIELDTDKTDESAQSGAASEAKASDAGADEKEAELRKLKDLLSEKETEGKEMLDRMQRLAAEFDNFRKRTQKEKDKLYGDAVSEVVAKFLPVADNLERAIKASESEEGQGLKEGILLVFKQISDILDKLDVKPIEAVGKTFNPDFHNAVMHVEDENLDHNIVVEEFQKGYTYKDETVIRHSMVKVAN